MKQLCIATLFVATLVHGDSLIDDAFNAPSSSYTGTTLSDSGMDNSFSGTSEIISNERHPTKDVANTDIQSQETTTPLNALTTQPEFTLTTESEKLSTIDPASIKIADEHTSIQLNSRAHDNTNKKDNIAQPQSNTNFISFKQGATTALIVLTSGAVIFIYRRIRL